MIHVAESMSAEEKNVMICSHERISAAWSAGISIQPVTIMQVIVVTVYMYNFWQTN